MKHIIITSLLAITLTSPLNAQIYKAKSDASVISFYSKSPLEDIEAVSKKVTIGLNTATNDVQVGVAMLSFKFRKPLMEEHFNENYVESDKYPTCVFKGKIQEPVDYKKDGDYAVTVIGTLTLHGVTKEIEVKGILTKKGHEIMITADFKIKIADYNIKVPSLYVQNIADIVDVKVNTTLEPFVKK